MDWGELEEWLRAHGMVLTLAPIVPEMQVAPHFYSWTATIRRIQQHPNKTTAIHGYEHSAETAISEAVRGWQETWARGGV